MWCTLTLILRSFFFFYFRDQCPSKKKKANSSSRATVTKYKANQDWLHVFFLRRTQLFSECRVKSSKEGRKDECRIWCKVDFNVTILFVAQFFDVTVTEFFLCDGNFTENSGEVQTVTFLLDLIASSESLKKVEVNEPFSGTKTSEILY